MSEKLRILLVEDNRADVDLIREMLPETGTPCFHIESVSRLSDALVRLKDRDIDLVLLDLGLPDSQGISTFHTLHKVAPGIPIIVLTGNADQELAVTAVKEGAQDFLVKGEVGGGVLVRSARYAIERKRAEEAVKKHHSLLAALINSANDIVIFSLDRDYRYTAFNDKHREEMKKAWAAEIKLGDCILDFMGIPELRAVARASMDRGLRGEIFTEVQHQPNLDIYYEFCWNPVELNKEIAGVTCFIRDITERKRAEESLKESEEKFKNIFDNSSIGKSITSLDGSVHVNPAFCLMLGYTMDELSHQKWPDISHPDDYELTRKNLKELQSGEKKSARFVKRYFKKDGSIIWADLSTVLQKDKEGKPLYYITAVVDITEHRKAEEALRESERKLSEAQKMAQLGHWDWDIKTGKVVWSDEVYRIFRLDPGKFTPHIDSILELSPWPEDHARDKELIRKAMESREKGGYEQRFLRPDKSIGYYDSTFQGRYDDHGNLVSIVGTVQDITERKRIDKVLQENEAKYRNLFDNAQIGMFRTKIDGSAILEVNQMLLDTFGFTREEMLASPATMRWAHPEERAKMAALLRADGFVTNLEAAFVTKTGEIRDFLISVRLYPEQGILEGSGLDITERKRAEAELLQKAEELSARNEELEQFNRGMIGRELRMIELKEEANELCRRLGEPARHSMDPLMNDSVPGDGPATALPGGGGA